MSASIYMGDFTRSHTKYAGTGVNYNIVLAVIFRQRACLHTRLCAYVCACVCLWSWSANFC